MGSGPGRPRPADDQRCRGTAAGTDPTTLRSGVVPNAMPCAGRDEASRQNPGARSRAREADRQPIKRRLCQRPGDGGIETIVQRWQNS